MNAVKHGMTARTPVLPGEDPDAFRHRLDTWAEALGPADAVEQFLVEQAATASWKIERADRIEAARLFAALRAAEDEQRAGRRKEADRLGRLLLGLDGPAADPALALEALRILDPGSPAPLADRTAPLRPIVNRLESTAEGCAWLLERWAELRDPLEQGTDWDEDRFVRAVRLSGRQPLNLAPAEWERYRQARHFGGVEELEPSGDEELDEERQEALEAAFSARVESEDRRRMARQLVEDLPEDESGARSALLGMVERAIGRLTELASAHEARWEAGAVERAERMTFDPGPDDELLWRHQFGCGRSMRRMLDTLLKLRREDRAAGRAAGREEGRSASPTAAPDEANAPAVAPQPCSPDEAGAPVVVHRPLQNEANAPAVDQGVHEEPPSGLVECSGSTDPRDPVVPVLTEQPTGVPECAPHTTSPTPVPEEASARAVAPTPVLDQATAPIVAPSSPQNEATAPTVDQAPVPDEATAPLAAPSSPQNEATDPPAAHPSRQDESTVPLVAPSSLRDEPRAQNCDDPSGQPTPLKVGACERVCVSWAFSSEEAEQ